MLSHGQLDFVGITQGLSPISTLFPNRISGKLYDHALIAQKDRASAS